MKVLHVCPYMHPSAGGPPVVVERHCQAAAENGWEASAVSTSLYCDDDGAQLQRSLSRRMDIEILPIDRPRLMGLSSRARSAIDVRVRSSDIVHLHTIWHPLGAMARQSCARHGRPYILSPHGMLDRWALGNAAWKKRVFAFLSERRNLERSACIHALNAAETEAVRDYGLRNPICVLPNGVELPSEVAASGPEWAHDLPGDARVLLYLGRLHPKKGLVGLLRSWSLVRQRECARNWYLVLAGWNEVGHRCDLEKLVRELEIDASVKFVGPQYDSDKARSFSRADAFVLPSFSEGSPMTVLEAWANSLPVMMTKECNLAEGFRHGAAVEISHDHAEMADELAAIFSLPDTARAQMGLNGRTLVARDFAWPTIVERMCQVYRWLVEDASCPACVLTERD